MRILRAALYTNIAAGKPARGRACAARRPRFSRTTRSRRKPGCQKTRTTGRYRCISMRIPGRSTIPGSNILAEDHAMRCRTGLKSVVVGLLGASALATTLWAQEGAGAGPWRGAGSPPCFGSEGAANKCPPAPQVMAVRAGHLFDSKTGQMLTKQVVLLQGERITDVGPEAQVKIPAGAKVIDLSQATVLPGLIDAHTHMFNPPQPGMSRETSTLDRDAEPASRSAGRLHVGARHELARQRLRRCRYAQRHQRGPHRRPAVSRCRAAASCGARPPATAPANPLASNVVQLGRGSARGGARARRARRRLDQAVPLRRLFLQPDRRARNMS